MFIIEHRMNSKELAQKLPSQWGAEIDLRSDRKQIYLNHDPFQTGESLDEFLGVYGSDHQAPLVLNMKEDGIETKAIASCEKFGISNFFFLDLSYPTLIKQAIQGEKRTAIRISEYEPLELIKPLQSKAEWVWLDCFSGRVPAENMITEIHDAGFRICLVSPELQKYDEDIVKKHIQIARLLKINDAVCTKFPEIWQSAKIL